MLLLLLVLNFIALETLPYGKCDGGIYKTAGVLMIIEAILLIICIKRLIEGINELKK